MELAVGFICTSPYLVCSVLTLLAQVFVLLFLPLSLSLSWTKRKGGLIHFLDFQVARTLEMSIYFWTYTWCVCGGTGLYVEVAVKWI